MKNFRNQLTTIILMVLFSFVSLMFVAVIGVECVSALNSTSSLDLNYTLIDNGNAYSVSKGSSDLYGNIIIPTEYNNKPVIEIADYAFTINSHSFLKLMCLVNPFS